MLSILSLFGPLAVRLIGKWLDKAKANADLRAAFAKFQLQMQDSGFLTIDPQAGIDQALADIERQRARDVEQRRAELDKLANGTGQPVEPNGKNPLVP